MERDDNVLEEDDVLISKWDSESTNDTCQDVKKLSSTIEFMDLVYKSEELLVDGLSNHFPSWNKLGIQLMKNVLEVISLNRLL